MAIHLIACALTIKALKPHVRRLNDGAGLYLKQSPIGNKHWYQDYTFCGKRNQIGLGRYPVIGLADARDRSLEVRRQVANGINPAQARKEAREPHVARNRPLSFQSVAEAWLAIQSKGWSTDHAEKVRVRLKAHAYPKLGALQISRVKSQDVVKVVAALRDVGTIDTAKRVLDLCRRVLDYATSMGHIAANPCSAMKEVLPSMTIKHRAACTTPFQLQGLLQRVRDLRAIFVVRCALDLTMLSLLRSTELRGAKWSEIDLNHQVWLVPAARMKGKSTRKLNGGAHYVPLSRQAVATLRKLREITGQTGYVFAGQGPKNPIISGNTVNKALRRSGISTRDEQSAHGFRATARTMLVEQLHFDDRLADLQLDHVVSDANGRAYNRTRMLKERAVMMQRWADYLDWLREQPVGALGLISDVEVPAALCAPVDGHWVVPVPSAEDALLTTRHTDAMVHKSVTTTSATH